MSDRIAGFRGDLFPCARSHARVLYNNEGNQGDDHKGQEKNYQKPRTGRHWNGRGIICYYFVVLLGCLFNKSEKRINPKEA